MNEEEIQKEIRGKIPQYKKASRMLATKGYYCRQAPYSGYGDLSGGKCAVYAIINNEIEQIAHNVTKHRAMVIISRLSDFLEKKIPKEVWENYCTNGYSTRIGINKSINKYNKNLHFQGKIKKIAKSHKIIKNKTKEAHMMRVLLRR